LSRRRGGTRRCRGAIIPRRERELIGDSHHLPGVGSPRPILPNQIEEPTMVPPRVALSRSREEPADHLLSGVVTEQHRARSPV
jgi:hypothetical protein